MSYCNFQNVLKEYQNDGKFLYSVSAARYRSTSPINTIVMFVPQQEVSIISKETVTIFYPLRFFGFILFSI